MKSFPIVVLLQGDYVGTVPLLGHLDEWAEVEVTNGSDATVARIRKDATAGYLFESSLELDTDGTTDFSIDATDVSDNTTSIDAQYVASGTGDWVALTYDDNGNTLTRSLTPTSGEVFTYHWDRENRLVKVERSAGPTTEFVYNAFGERVKIIEDADGTPIERRFIHSGAEVLQERDASNVVLRNYYPQGEERLDETGDPQYYYTRDHLGSIRELIRKSDGTVVGRWDYSPYGIPEDLIGGAGSVDCEFGFTGHFTHEDSDLVLTYFRGYVPGLGRWLSPDPLGELGPDGANLYGYVQNNPLNFFDPDGFGGIKWYHRLPSLGQLMNPNYRQGAVDQLTDGQAWKESAAAAADGFNPFGDPFAKSGAYDPCDEDLQVGKGLGALSRNITLTAVGVGVWNAARLPTISVYVTRGAGSSPHFFYGVSGAGRTVWAQGVRAGIVEERVGLAAFTRWYNGISGIPILFRGAVLAAEGSAAGNCASAAGAAVRRAFFKF